jgi:hypothetical protein
VNGKPIYCPSDCLINNARTIEKTINEFTKYLLDNVLITQNEILQAIREQSAK